jgi:hypothetical protein
MSRDNTSSARTEATIKRYSPLAEQHDEWVESRRYLGLDALAKSQAVGTAVTEEVAIEISALSA